MCDAYSIFRDYWAREIDKKASPTYYNKRGSFQGNCNTCWKVPTNIITWLSFHFTKLEFYSYFSWNEGNHNKLVGLRPAMVHWVGSRKTSFVVEAPQIYLYTYIRALKCEYSFCDMCHTLFLNSSSSAQLSVGFARLMVQRSHSLLLRIYAYMYLLA